MCLSKNKTRWPVCFSSQELKEGSHVYLMSGLLPGLGFIVTISWLLFQPKPKHSWRMITSWLLTRARTLQLSSKGKEGASVGATPRDTLLPSSPVPAPHPRPGHSLGAYLQKTFTSSLQRSRRGMGREGERRLRHSVSDVASPKRKANRSHPPGLSGEHSDWPCPLSPWRERNLTWIWWGFY